MAYDKCEAVAIKPQSQLGVIDDRLRRIFESVLEAKARVRNVADNLLGPEPPTPTVAGNVCAVPVPSAVTARLRDATDDVGRALEQLHEQIARIEAL